MILIQRCVSSVTTVYGNRQHLGLDDLLLYFFFVALYLVLRVQFLHVFALNLHAIGSLEVVKFTRVFGKIVHFSVNHVYQIVELSQIIIIATNATLAHLIAHVSLLTGFPWL